MIHIDKNSNISCCFFCKVHKRTICKCTSLNITVEEHYNYKIEDINLLKNQNWLKNYEESKKLLVKNIKEKFPKAKKIKMYPFFKETLPFFKNNL